MGFWGAFKVAAGIVLGVVFVFVVLVCLAMVAQQFVT